MEIRHLDAIVAIDKGVNPFPWSRQQFLDSLRAGDRCWVLSQEAQVLGYAVMRIVVPEAELLTIALAPACQRLGYGRLLLEGALVNAAESGVTQCFLEVRQSNVSAQKFYRRLGFQAVGLRRAYYPTKEGRENAILMTKQTSR